MAKTPPAEVDVQGRTVRVSSPDRVVFASAGLTKLDIVHYVLAIGDGILAAVQHRPTTLERWPRGVPDQGGTLGDDGFYQKRAPTGAPDWVRTATVTFPSGRTAEEVCPTELAVVAWAVNLGTLTFHPWPVTRTDTDSPDQLRIDLDPQPGTDFTNVVGAARVLREVLDGLGMVGAPKTSGGRGLHVVIPIRPLWTFVEARRATIAIGRELERRMPEQVTTAWWKEERGARVFVDYNQMARDRTIASAYSIRANPRATVSTPLRWDELDDVRPEDLTVATVPSRFAELGDLAAPVRADADERYSLAPALELAERDEADRGLGDLPYPPEYPKMPGEPPRVQPSRAKRQD